MQWMCLRPVWFGCFVIRVSLPKAKSRKNDVWAFDTSLIIIIAKMLLYTTVIQPLWMCWIVSFDFSGAAIEWDRKRKLNWVTHCTENKNYLIEIDDIWFCRCSAVLTNIWMYKTCWRLIVSKNHPKQFLLLNIPTRLHISKWIMNPSHR